MSHTNSTTNYSLPQFITTDKPAWLTDVNGAMSAIDTAIKNAADDASTANTNASQAILDAGTASSAASSADAKASGALDSLAAAFSATSTYAVGDLVIYNSLLYVCTVAVSTPGAWTGSTNWSRVNVASIVPSESADLPFVAGGVSTYAKINAIENTITQIKFDGANEQTSASGNISITKPNKFIPIAAWTKSAATVIDIYSDSTVDSSGNTTWTLHFASIPSYAPLANATITYYYAYIER